jgi:hypothetical protein
MHAWAGMLAALMLDLMDSVRVWCQVLLGLASAGLVAQLNGPDGQHACQ